MTRHQHNDTGWHSQAELFIKNFVAPTKRQRYLDKPDLLTTNIAHDLGRHLDSRRAVQVGSSTHVAENLIRVVRAVAGNLDSGYCVVKGPYCPPEWTNHREVPLSELLSNKIWWLSSVLFVFGRGSVGYYAAEEAKKATRVILVKKELAEDQMLQLMLL